MLNFEQHTWYNKNDPYNQDKRIPITAFHLNRIEEGVNHSVDGVNKMFNYWWRKKDLIDSGTIKYGDFSTTLIWLTSSSATSTFYYSDSISVKIDETTHKGYIELDNPSSIDMSYYTDNDTHLRNKYFMIGTTSGKEAYYMGEEGYADGHKNADHNPSFGIYIYNGCKVACFVTYGDVEYIESDKIDAYPNGWSSDDGALYEFLGIPFENSRESLRMMHGYYCGDGTSSRLINTPPNPKCVLWSPCESKQSIVAESFSGGSVASSIHLTSEGFTVNSSVNTVGTIYNYIIFY